MKAIMYHYVREYNSRLPNFRFLDVKNFEKQLNYFQNKFGFVSKDEWLQALDSKKLGSAKGKIMLTFDDAMSCHYDYVYKVLNKLGLWGIFYVPTQPYQKGQLLDVHKIHLLCGAFEGTELLAALNAILDDSMISHQKRKEFLDLTYLETDNYDGVAEFKRMLNYLVSYEHREALIDSIAGELNFSFSFSDFYVSLENLREMELGGNIIGSHSSSHPVMSRLNESEQQAEINGSFDFLSSNLNSNLKTYCHPYGGFHTFDKTTVKTLNAIGATFSFNVESRDICDNDLTSSIQFLPRYDCNEFSFGQAS